MVLLTNASGAGYSWRVENVNNVGRLFETRHGVATTNEWQMHRGHSCCLYLSLSPPPWQGTAILYILSKKAYLHHVCSSQEYRHRNQRAHSPEHLSNLAADWASNTGS